MNRRTSTGGRKAPSLLAFDLTLAASFVLLLALSGVRSDWIERLALTILMAGPACLAVIMTLRRTGGGR